MRWNDSQDIDFPHRHVLLSYVSFTITLNPRHMKNRNILLILALIVLASCTATPVDVTECATGQPAGFWLGLWHGIIAPVTFIISLFTDNIEMYQSFNNGGWYDFGFVLGAGILFGGSGSGSRTYRKRRRRERE